MAVHFEHLDIRCFRGLKEVEVSRLRDVNIIAGDNNSGKTSFMEALCLFRKPNDFYNVLKVARMRDASPFLSSAVYENFINLFPKNEMYIGMHAIGNMGESHLEIHGEEQKELLNIEMLSPYVRNKYSNHNKPDFAQETLMFHGEMHGWDKSGSFHDNIHLHPFVKAYEMSFRNKRLPDSINIVYLSPLAHMQGNTFNKIVKNPDYKYICLKLLQLFDSNITDLLYLKNENTSRAIEYLEHKELGVMPLSTYGDGIKKVLSLANGIASAAGGILLIDEIETSINYKYYSEIFSFIILASQQFDVQVFITTHNSEVIDGLLGTRVYDENDDYDPISVITFRKDPETSLVHTRSLSGKEVYEDRKRFGFEVRL